MSNRRSLLSGLIGLGGFGAIARGADDAEQGFFDHGLQLFFAQRDRITSFDYNTGIGTHLGTVEGSVVGTSITNFQFTPASQTKVNFDNRVIITDIDGDQIVFSSVGTGRYVFPPASDPSSPLGNLLLFGGPLVSTYTALIATGKYAPIQGVKLPCKMVITNVARPSVSGLGDVYVEVYSDNVGTRGILK